MSNIKYWVWLAMNPRLSPLKTAMLVENFGGPEQVASAGRDILESLGWLTMSEINSLMLHDFRAAEDVINDCELGGISIMTMQDAAYPERLRNIPDPPAVLYYKGRMPDLDSAVPISVVGMRKCTERGRKTAESLAHDLSRGGAYILSGLAYGIDSAAHVGALRAGCGTTAVLGCGCDVVYPPENKELYKEIEQAGALISEYPPGVRPFGQNFPRRNRILSGLAKGVLVVEAEAQSGSLITAEFALEQGRDVFAVPGSPGTPGSDGTNALIRDSAAKLVTCAEDILCEYESLLRRRRDRIVESEPEPDAARGRRSSGSASGSKSSGRTEHAPEDTPEENTPEESEAIKIQPEKIKDFTERQRNIILSIAENPKTAEELTEELGLEAREVLGELTMLQIEGAVETNGGGIFSPAREFFRTK